VLSALGRGFGSVMVQPVHGNADKPAIRILVRATKGGRAPLVLFPGLLLNDPSGHPNPIARAVLAGEQILPLAQS
ncbi:methyltransferase, partial [Rhodopseudomonas sp. BR0C11]|nr:methyltransferase [Rhodopseudomonas sp. BR0C11]